MLVALLLATFIGLALGLFGGGGSILSVAILTYALGMPPKAAIAASLLIIGITSSAALLAHLRSGLVSFRTGIVFGGAGMAGAYAGGRLAVFIPDGLLLAGFGLMMLITSVAMLRAKPVAAQLDAADSRSGRRTALMLLRGLGVGVVTGMIGAGGGFLIVPALVLLGGMPMKRAVATSLLVIAMQSLAGFAGHLGHSSVDWQVVGPFTLMATLGSIAGGVLAQRTPQRLLRRGFAWLVLLFGVFVVARQLPDAVKHSALYQHVFVARWPWWLGGMAIASVVLGLLFSENKLLGVSTGCAELCRLPRSADARASWRPRFLLGIALGGALAALLAGYSPTLSMGSFDSLASSGAARLSLLFGAGLLIGTGARLAGGCTSGHGIVGTALGARSSWLATALFLLGGFATTRVLLLLGGGMQ